MNWQRTFDFTRSLPEVWAAFVDQQPDFTWNDVLPQAQVDVATHRISWSDYQDDIGVEMSMVLVFQRSGDGTRVTLTRSGAGEGDMFEVRQASKMVAWGEVMHDLAVYLETGEDLRRLHMQRCATGIQLEEVQGGMRVTDTVPGSFGERAGLEAGDLVVQLAGVPVFDRHDLWLLQRLVEPGDETSVRFARGSELHEAVARMSEVDFWATGELGGGPRS